LLRTLPRPIDEWSSPPRHLLDACCKHAWLPVPMHRDQGRWFVEFDVGATAREVERTRGVFDVPRVWGVARGSFTECRNTHSGGDLRGWRASPQWRDRKSLSFPVTGINENRDFDRSGGRRIICHFNDPMDANAPSRRRSLPTQSVRRTGRHNPHLARRSAYRHRSAEFSCCGPAARRRERRGAMLSQSNLTFTPMANWPPCPVRRRMCG